MEKSRKTTSKGPGKNKEKGRGQEAPKKSSEGLGKGGKMHKKAVNNRKGRNSKMTAEAKEV
jgi:hypothetical protein